MASPARKDTATPLTQRNKAGMEPRIKLINMEAV